MRVAEALAHARAAGVDRLDAQLLLSHRLCRARSWLLAHDEDEVPAASAAAFEADVAARARGCPLAYLTGRREFHGLDLAVGPAVLVPRPETEGLVDWALELLAGTASADVIDLGTGSGAVALALAHARRDLRVCAVDVDVAALAVARANAAALGLEVAFIASDWWRAVPPQARYACVLSNPPYVAEGDPHLQALSHEPQHALVAGADGLDAMRTIIDGSSEHLEPGGWLLLEHGWDQGPAVRERLGAAGFGEVTTRRDLAGLERCTAGHWRG